MIDGAPEIAELAVDLYKHLVQMPLPLRIAVHVLADVDPALGQEILDVA
jgi:hypothetical protein